MPPATQDPFYIVRQEIQETVNELQQKMSRFHGLTASNPERKTVGASVEAGCESLRWQLSELDAAVGRAAADPGRFNLTAQEIEGRRRWVTNTRRQVDGMSEALKTALAAPPPPSADAKFVAANDKFLSSQAGQQELVLKEQDQHLDDIEQAVTRLGRMGMTIHEELESQNQLLGELEEDVDTVSSRLKATQKKMMDIIKKSGSTTQLAVIGFLVVVLIILAVFVFH